MQSPHPLTPVAAIFFVVVEKGCAGVEVRELHGMSALRQQSFVHQLRCVSAGSQI